MVSGSTLELTDELAEALLRTVMKNAYRKEYEEYICVDALGMLFRPSYVSSHFEVILKRNGLRKIRFHDLRHPNVKLSTKDFLPNFT